MSTDKGKIGRIFEELFVKRYSTNKVPRSGAGFVYKLDADNAKFLFSLKATKNKSFSVKKEDLEEVHEGVRGQGGIAADHIPMMIYSLVEGEEPSPSDKIYAVLEFDDLVQLLTEDGKVFESTKVDDKYATSKVPSILRD